MAADTGEAEAIIQETFWRVWQALPRYKEDRRFFPYLVTIAANRMRDAWRKEHRVLPDEFDAIADHFDESPSPEMQVVEAELLNSLTKAVKELPPLYRAVIALRYDAVLSYEGIASAMGLPLNTVRTYLYRAKSALHKSLKEAYG
jgi:RNA polymerase sigma-70 factor (ECF subfamily)